MTAVEPLDTPVGKLSFELAGPADGPVLRRLAREQSLPGWVTLAFEREPDFFQAAAVEGDPHQVLIAREAASGRIVAMHSRAVRDVYIDGKIERLGYLGQLRTDPAIPGRRWRYRLMREGFAAGRRLLRAHDELPYDLTSILEDHDAARRLLERGLPGLPRYTRITDWNTLAFSCRIGVGSSSACAVRRGSVADVPRIVRLLEQCYARCQFAPAWKEADLRSPVRCRGLAAEDFLLAERENDLLGCAAVWDQRGFKQTVVRGYRAPIPFVRPVYNLLAPLLRRPRLPDIGSALRQGWISHFAIRGEDRVVGRALIRAALDLAARKGLDQVLLGLADSHFARRALERAFRPLRYRSILYLVHWPDEPVPIPDTATRIVHVETATL